MLTQATAARELPQQLYTSDLYRTCKNAASSFKTHLRAHHLSMRGNGVISGREPLIMQPIGQGRVLYMQPLHIMYHGNCVLKTIVVFLDLLVSPHRRGWPGGHPKSSFVWVATQKCPPKCHCRGCGANALPDPDSVGSACGGCSLEVSKGMQWSSW